MPTVDYVHDLVESMFTVSFLLVVFIHCLYHIFSFWAACSKAFQKDQTNSGDNNPVNPSK